MMIMAIMMMVIMFFVIQHINAGLLHGFAGFGLLCNQHVIDAKDLGVNLIDHEVKPAEKLIRYNA